ncbi:hypothetical protein TELCIR_15996, partial [Teladorsagia circumcincta]
MAATWADIQRLVSDLQRVQLSQSSKKLSEANCVEVVSKLIQRSLIDVVFTRDGHSYITQKHLATEVRNECVALGGRAPLTDIATSLNVDLEHVERVAHKLASENTEFKISGGELFAERFPRHGSIMSALQPLAIPFDDSDLVAISEQVASSESGLHSAGTHIFSDRILSKTIERLGDRIDAWAHDLMSRIQQERKGTQQQKKVVEVDDDWGDSKKGGGKKKGGRGGGGGKGAKSAGATRDEPSATVIGVPSETLEEWVHATEAVPEEIMEDVVERIGPQ